MDFLHWEGARMTAFVQNVIGNDHLMLLTSRIGDPRSSFLVFFPLAYSFSTVLGTRVLLIACLSEWLNMVLKWCLLGERPYWWVREFSNDGAPSLRQFSITCETGPGSPSGHVMVTASVFYLLIGEIVSAGHVRKTRAWAGYCLCVLAVALSRVYIASHFPHQVVLGAAVGVLLAYLFTRFSLFDDIPSLLQCVVCSVTLIVTAIAVYGTVLALGFDPSFSIPKATKWCVRSEWVHLDTTPFFAFSRDVGSLLGLGVSSLLVRKNSKPSVNVYRQLLTFVIACLLCHCLENIRGPFIGQSVLFYAVSLGSSSLLSITTCLLKILIQK